MSDKLLPEYDPGPSEAEVPVGLVEAPGHQAPGEASVSGIDANSNMDPGSRHLHLEKGQSKVDCISTFLNQNDVQSQVASLTKSSLATYKKPTQTFHNIINILNDRRPQNF